MAEPTILEDLQALFLKHKVAAGLLVIPQDEEFTLLSHEITVAQLHLLGTLLVKHLPSNRGRLN